ncbi:nucleotidyl transferase AbiEii/AbiGii toxin family protein [Aliarcobacter skirrowii]|uniref:nucleotidyl transferase AbiEii/AbiGii toxin family protein n=1 Tax=Aliarcobacter skirrowii TaxID=28200 RepID=UPI0029A92263|nr:nucleotidyl transferase AbiEii/AbiGii toxin family protein [Aliarcobacter skirrowii]MDX4064013.1 nucleotidyl transferase AbiEii/AbiGii toxin family protein [Aliarcobacter skirrowii]
MNKIDIKGSMPKKTEILFEKISKGNELKDFVFAGGTALAIYIKHRTSEDLDFFINKNILNNRIKKEIESLIKRLENEGYIITLISNYDDVQLDYMFGDVKVTFLASSLKLLDDSIKYKNINIANIEKIAAGKLYTILKYRIKSRDFYDVKYIMKYYKLEFCQIFDLMKKHYGRVNFSEEIINTRFLKMPLNIDDEGFESLQLKEKESFKTLRDFFKKEIKKLNDEKKEIFHFTKNDIEKNINKNYGLLRQSLLMELYNISKYSIIFDIDLLKVNANLLYSDLNGRTIFNLSFEENDFFDYLLFYIDEIPSDIKTICQNSGNQKALETIELHRLINRCLKKDNIEIEQILKDKDINKDIFFKKLTKKKEILYPMG